MNGYFITLLVVSFVGGIINSILPSGGLKKYVKYIISLVCVITLVSPLTSIVLNATSIKDGIINFVDNTIIKDKIEISNSLILNTSAEKIGDGIKDTIIDKYGFEEKEVIVDVLFNDENKSSITIEKIEIYLTGKASWSDCTKIEEYLKSLTGCNISVKRRWFYV